MTPADYAILDLEFRRYRQPGAKLSAIHDLGYSETRYAQRLWQLLQTEEALAHAPALVWRLRRRVGLA